MGHPIFISYRRDDTEGEAGRLFDDLTRQFGNDCVFMDVAGISPGVDFRKAIEDNVSGCGVLLAMIGPAWLTIADASGNRRLDNPNDYVALEISSALKRNVPVIPVLVHDARMPHPDQLPEVLKDLAYRNSVELTHARWNSDAALLIEALKPYVTSAKPADSEPVHATVAVQLPAPNPDAASAPEAPRTGSKTGIILGGSIVLVIAIAVAAFVVLRPNQQPVQPQPVPVTNSNAGGLQARRDASAIEGRWVNPEERNGNSLSTLEISRNGDRMLMHAWGTCKPEQCDWGAQAAQFDGSSLIATFTPSAKGKEDNADRFAVVSAHRNGDNLEVTVQNTFKQGDAARKNQTTHTFVPAK